MVNKLFFLFLILFLYHCNVDIDSDSKYSYRQTLEIFAITQYVGKTDKIKKYLENDYTLENISEQKKYKRSLDQINTLEAWKKLNIDAIDYYINIKKDIRVEFYPLKAFEEKLNRFNNNLKLDVKEQLPDEYWKTYILNDYTRFQVIFSKELYKKNQIVYKEWYSESARSIIKKAQYEFGKVVKTAYYINQKEIK